MYQMGGPGMPGGPGGGQFGGQNVPGGAPGGGGPGGGFGGGPGVADSAAAEEDLEALAGAAGEPGGGAALAVPERSSAIAERPARSTAWSS